MAAGENNGTAYYPLRLTRARAFGGSSRAWVGHGLKAAPLDEIDMTAREGMPFHGWPFERKDLDPWYEQAHDVCNLGAFDYDPASAARQTATTVLPVDERWVRSTLFRYGLDSGFERFAQALTVAANVQLVTHATVRRVGTHATGVVVGVEGGTLDGTDFAVHADTFILAAGAIETARLLLVSTDHDPRGVGNQHDLVGRFFMEHPDLEVGFFIPDPQLSIDDVRLYQHVPVSAHVNANAMFRPSDALLARERLLNSVIRLRPSYETAMPPAVRSARVVRRSAHLAVPSNNLIGHAVRAVTATPTLVRHLTHKRSSQPTVFQLDIMSEQEPNPESRVRLGQRPDRLGLPRTVLDWRLTDNDWHAVDRACAVLAEAVADAGLGRVVNTVKDWPGRPAVFGNWHHLGTTRMHVDPTQGVVDEHCRVHGIDNLYISGGSVFPTGGYANPTLTIVALALRLADHLTEAR